MGVVVVVKGQSCILKNLGGKVSFFFLFKFQSQYRYYGWGWRVGI